MQYRESQKFNQWWLWLLNLGLMGIVFWGAYQEYQDGMPLWQALLAIALVAVFALVPLALIELRTTITDDGVEVRFWPFSRRRIFKSEIKSMHVRSYSPLGEYGGWGYRLGASAGKAYNTMGNRGLQLELHDGEKILIGTQRPEELSVFVHEWLAEADVLTEEVVELKLKELREDKLKR
jgi:hypothetical protein